THKVSKITMDVILTSIENCRLELLNEPSVIAYTGKEYYFRPEIKSPKACKSVINLKHSLIVSPVWLSIDNLSGIITGKPSQANIGDTLYSYKTIDGTGGFIIRDVMVKVTEE
ncbi:MAG: hypothetical protein KAI99_11640, partial [Cyclobacteriaceae bacterium]|nr:hypothetical protein [Cyclobacteriaceae bacterium]